MFYVIWLFSLEADFEKQGAILIVHLRLNIYIPPNLHVMT